MPELRNKTILIISPQSWGKMFISKHHYGIELAKKGNEVYFLNPPDNHKINLSGKSKRVKIEKLKEHSNLHLISQELYFPYMLKFHAKKLYDFFMKKQVKDVLKMIKKPVDIIWSFDLGNLYQFHHFDSKAYKIFHPVDEPLVRDAIESAKGSDIIFSVTNEILEKYEAFKMPKHFINHGVTENFFHHHEQIKKGDKIHVGLSGNLLRPDIDRETLLTIIHQNPEIIFDFFGSYEKAQSNIGVWQDDATLDFIEALKKFSNVILHGTLATDQLSSALFEMDCFLICYDIKKDQSKGTNYHKIMEYLSTGKVIVSNNVTTYRSRPDLLRMTVSRENNDELPSLFKETIHCLRKYNSEEMRQQRISYARKNTYQEQIEQIEKLLPDF